MISDYSRIFSKLNYFPIKLLTRVGDSQHAGGSLPMSKEYKEFNNTNNLGLTKVDRNTHFVDSSILPKLPSYLIGLTIMANANYMSK